MSTGRKGQQGAAPWGGLVPAGLKQHTTPAPEAKPEAAPPVPEPTSDVDRVLQRLDKLAVTIGGVSAATNEACYLPPELLPFVFDGKQNLTRQRDDHTQQAYSYGLYNPSEVPVFIAVGGTDPTLAAGAFEVPSPGWVVLPVMVGSVMLGADPTALAEKQITVYRLRFHTVQAFNMGSL